MSSFTDKKPCPLCKVPIYRNMKRCPECKGSIPKEGRNSLREKPVDLPSFDPDVEVEAEVEVESLLTDQLNSLDPEDRKKVLSSRDRLVAEARDIDHLGLLALGLASTVLHKELEV